METGSELPNTSKTPEVWSYLQSSGNVQGHLLDVADGECLETLLFPPFYQVVEGLLSPVLHGQTLGAIRRCGEGSEPWRHTRM